MLYIGYLIFANGQNIKKKCFRKIPLPLASHFEESARTLESVNEAGMHAGRNTQLGFSGVSLHLQTKKRLIAAVTDSSQVEKTARERTGISSIPGLTRWPRDGLSRSRFWFADQGSNPPQAQTFDHPPSPPKKVVPKWGGGGVEGSKSKNSLGDHFVWQNNDFTKGYTSNIVPWGMVHE